MGWSEELFQKAERWISNLEQKRKGWLPSEHAIAFADMKSLLNCWVILISGRTWTLQEAETWPGRDAERLFLPVTLDLFQDPVLNRRAYFYIACYLLNCDEHRFPELRRWRSQFQLATLTLSQNEQGVAGLRLHQAEDVPPHHEVRPWTPASIRSLWNLWTVRELPITRNQRGDESSQESRNSNAKAERKKKAREKIEVLENLGDPESENPLVHSFEKLHTTDDYTGGQKKQDGEDELEEQQDSLEDLDLKQVVRTPQSTQATLKGDFVMDLEVAESRDVEEVSHSRIFQYPEWDDGRGEFLNNWCRLQECVPEKCNEPSDFDLFEVRKKKKRHIENLSRQFHSLLQSSKWKTRQSEGTELDWDALVDFMATPPEKRPETMRVYSARRKNVNDVAVVILFDRSLSSDSWIRDRRVLDITRESLVVIGEALKKFPLPVQLAAFSSQTRHRIRYDVLKGFDESWEPGLQRLGSVDPLGYTRIGPALRHSISGLEKRKAKHKWIILLSDAKPTDYDRYEGRYGVRDVRKAMQEARAADIGIRCLSVEKHNRYELAEMFGPRGYELISHVDDLPIRLGLLLRDLAQKSR